VGGAARLILDHDGVRAVLARERDERLSAAADLEQHGRADRGAALRGDAEVIGRYLEAEPPSEAPRERFAPEVDL
jgi:uncharacterized protein YqeY